MTAAGESDDVAGYGASTLSPQEKDGQMRRQRNFREDDEVWEAASAKAEAEGTTVSAKIREWLRKYLAGKLD